ncbi:hypothetical protein M413DRAFT_245965 [Hebeloma cylindrosporum]|uniref:Uncharacterized protein n=1 Tax=Hebeloma cylindrosporum TaxID=76867 RepID=A0A0C2YBM3_HEBCY|nr:hypothetical protein M413DRAFT_245965 [Hebeloma cylindrosporum h7]
MLIMRSCNSLAEPVDIQSRPSQSKNKPKTPAHLPPYCIHGNHLLPQLTPNGAVSIIVKPLINITDNKGLLVDEVQIWAKGLNRTNSESEAEFCISPVRIPDSFLQFDVHIV